MITTEPIACTLTPGEFTERLAWIADLNRSALRFHAVDDLKLVLSYAPSAASRVKELAEREGQCCAFLAFRIDESANEVRLTVGAPEQAREAVDGIFAPFLSGVPTASSPNRLPVAACSGGTCGCGPTATGETAIAAPAAIKRKGVGHFTSIATGTAGASALACGVCCVIPFIFPAIALTMAGGVVAAFAGVYRWAMNLSLALAAAGWSWLMWQSLRTRRKPNAASLRGIALATVVVATALSWPFIERALRAAFKS